MPRPSTDYQDQVAEDEEIITEEPQLYRVLLLNDDYTTMEFVVIILQQVFRKSAQEAERLMMLVHKSGAATAGIYTREVAETKVAIVHHLAQQHEFPLRCRMEPE